jgi:hypothetical protein
MTLLGRTGLLLIVFSLLVTFGHTAEAHRLQCGDRESIFTQLEEKHGEVPIAAGVGGNGTLVQLFTTADGGTWSIIMTSPNGKSCLVASGEGWREMETILRGDPI